MPQKRKESKQEGKELVKRTILFPPALDQKLAELCFLTGKDLSKVLRAIITDNLDYYLKRASLVTPAEASRSAPETNLPSAVEELLGQAASRMGLTPAALMRLIVCEKVIEYHQRALEQEALLRKTLEGG